MNVWQVCQIIQSKLRARTWPNGTAVVFDTNSVRVIPQGDEIAALDEGLILPLCLLMSLSGEMDSEHREEPNYVRRVIDITLVTSNQGDRIGETPIMGGMKANLITSPGRGLLELEEQLFAVIAKLGVEQGIIIQFSGFGEGIVRRDAGNNYIGIQDYTFVVYCSTESEYPGVDNYVARGGTADIIVNFTYPMTNPMTYRAVTVYKAGSTPPTSISDGTVAESTTGWTGLAAHSLTISGLAPGTYSVATFVTYCDPNVTPQTDQYSSTAASGTVIAS